MPLHPFAAKVQFAISTDRTSYLPGAPITVLIRAHSSVDLPIAGGRAELIIATCYSYRESSLNHRGEAMYVTSPPTAKK